MIPAALSQNLLLRFFVHLLGAAPIAILFELNLALHQLLIFGGPVISALALATRELNQPFLRHRKRLYRKNI